MLVALTVIALLSDGRTSYRILIRLLCVTLGVLAHENMLPYFAVLIGLDLLLANRNGKNGLVLVALPVISGITVRALFAAFAGFSAEETATFAEHLQSKADFRLAPISTDVAGRSIASNFVLMSELRGTNRYWTRVLFDGVPLLILSAWLLWPAFQIVGRDTNAKIGLLLTGAVLASISLNFIAFEAVRFGVVSVLCGFIAITLLLKHVPNTAERREKVLSWPHFVLVLVLNASIFSIEVNAGAGHLSQFPWVLLT